MRRLPRLSVASLLLCLSMANAQVSQPLQPYVKYAAPALVLEHLRIIDGTGVSPVDDCRIDIQAGKISGVQCGQSSGSHPAGAKVLNMTGKTVIPGLVGMHEHLFYPLPDAPPDGLALYGEMADSAPRLYLAGGVTTARTAGSLEPYTDLDLKRLIDAGKIPGPKLHITGPYLGSFGDFAPQLHTLRSPDEAARTVDYWAAEGVTSFKAYMDIKPAELKAAIEHAHAKGLKITGHLCSVGFGEAAALGIDNLEHGLVVDTEFLPAKKEGICPSQNETLQYMAGSLDVEGPQVQRTIRDLVAHHVAVTSTLAVFETFVPNRPPMKYAVGLHQALTESAWAEFLGSRSAVAERPAAAGFTAVLKKEMQFERDFVKNNGRLMIGCDPTGYGGVLPGFGDQRELELLVEAGFTPVEAIHIATANGAAFLGDDSIGSITPGKAADLVILSGNPAQQIADIEKVDTVFKDGIGYDPAKLRDSVHGLVGLR